MNVFDKILVCLFLLGILIWQALHQAHVFKQQKTISHFWKGVWYALAVGIAVIPYVANFDWWYLLKIPIIGITERMALFDPILNKAHNEPFFYNGPKVQVSKSNGSWLDQLENKLTETQLVILKVVYIILFIVAVICIK
jgi:hypothetical protein